MSGGGPITETTSPPRRVLPLLLVAYAAFYLCRANVEPALNLLAIEHGYDNEELGIVMAIALGAYAVGKLVFGPLADVLGGKRILVGALFGTAFVSLAIAASDAPRRFGASIGLVVIGVLVVANRFVQAGGWGGLVDVVGAIYGPSRRGTIMGILSTSYDVGNVLALVLSAGVVHLGAGWRALFVVNPLVVIAVALVVRAALPGGPTRDRSAKAEDRDHPAEGDPASPPFAHIALGLARERALWFATAASFLLTFVRAGFMTWTPRFLYEVSVAANVPSPTSSSIAKSAFFGVAGIIGSVVTGRISDRLGPGRRAPVMTTSLALLLVCTLGLAHAGVRSPVIATLGVAACGLFLLGPYSLLAGAVFPGRGGRGDRRERRPVRPRARRPRRGDSRRVHRCGRLRGGEPRGLRAGQRLEAGRLDGRFRRRRGRHVPSSTGRRDVGRTSRPPEIRARGVGLTRFLRLSSRAGFTIMRVRCQTSAQ